MLMEHKLSQKVSELEDNTNKLFKIVFERLDTVEQIVPTHNPKRKKIGLKVD